MTSRSTIKSSSTACSSSSAASSSMSPTYQQSLENQPQKQRRTLLNNCTSNIEARCDLIHLVAAELDGMSTSIVSVSSPSQLLLNQHENSVTHHSSTASNDNNFHTKNLCDSTNRKQLSTMSSITTEDEQIIEIERPFPPGCLHLLYSLPSNSSCHDCHSHPAQWASISYGITLCLQCSGKHRSLGVQYSVVKSLQLDSWKRREILCMLEGGNEQLSQFFERHEMGCGNTRSGNSMHESSNDVSQDRYERELVNNSGSCRKRDEDGDGIQILKTKNVGTDKIIAANSRGTDNTSSSWLLDRYKTKAASFYRQHLMGHAVRLSKQGGLYEGREASRGRGGGESIKK